MNAWVQRLYWQACVLGLFGGLLGARQAMAAGLVVCVGQLLHAIAANGPLLKLQIQVRLAYLLLYASGVTTWQYAWLIHLMMLTGTLMLLLVDYCFLARVLTLLPWNRSVPLDMRLAWRVITAPPGPGTVASRLGIQ